MKKRIFRYYLILIVIVLSVTVVFTSEVSRKHYKNEVENKLRSIGFSIEYYLLRSDKEIDYDFTAKDYAAGYNLNGESFEDKLRITFIDFAGNILGDSEADYARMENHLDRKEVQEALKGGTGRDIRRSETVNTDFLYVAIPLKQRNTIVRVSVPLVQLKKIDEMIWLYSILIIISGLLVAVLISSRMTNSLIRPLKDMALASEGISKGNYKKRIAVKSNDELGQLALNFNDMATKLDKTISDLNSKKMEVESIVDSITNGIVAIDNSNRIILINPAACDVFRIESPESVIGGKIAEHIRNRRMNLILEEAVNENKSMQCEVKTDDKILHVNAFPIKTRNNGTKNSGGILFIQDITKVRKLEQLRTEFVSNVTHELKTPITSIRGFIETLKNGSINNRKVAEKFLDIIDIEADRLYTLINDILQLSEIETRQEDTDLEDVSLKNVINDVFEMLKNLADEKDITLNNRVDEQLTIRANANRMKQMLLNLADNGIKYNVSGGSVEIDARRGGGKLTISVKDTGIGIPPEHIPRIFERFYRVDRGRSRDMGGTGLGLSIVKHIVNLYNGDIKVNTEAGRGTEFIIQLPS